jgi:hypothetical protein
MARDAELEGKVFKLPGGKEFKEEVDGLSVDDLEIRISNMQKGLDESREHKKNNEALKKVSAEKSELEGPYKDVENAVKVKTKYIIELIKEKGGQ